MGSGENLFAGIGVAQFGYCCTEHAFTELAIQVVLKKEAPAQNLLIYLESLDQTYISRQFMRDEMIFLNPALSVAL